MREDGIIGTGDSHDTSSSSFMVIGDSGGGDGGGGGSGGGGGDDDDDRHRQHFVRTLDSKLRKLHRRNAAEKQTSSRKPVFVTTVKTGIFLDPPPDLAVLLGLDDRSSSSTADSIRRYYSYSSKPRVLYDKHHQRVARKVDHPPELMCNQIDYTNIMHDKRVVRGSNYAKNQLFRPKWNPYFGYAKQLSSEFNKESPTARKEEARRREMARKKAMNHGTRALRFHLDAPKFTRGRQNVDVQTDTHLEELFEYPQSQTFGAQTEFNEELFSHPGTGTSVGTDASTQVDDKDLFDFDTEVAPIAETLIADVFRQAMREVLYEDELDARARQQRALYLRHTVEDIEKKRLEFKDERLNNVITDHAQLFNEAEKVEETLASEKISNHIDNIVNDKNLTNTNTIESPEFISWMMEELQINKAKNIANDENLKNIIYDLYIKRHMDTSQLNKNKEIADS